MLSPSDSRLAAKVERLRAPPTPKKPARLNKNTLHHVPRVGLVFVGSTYLLATALKIDGWVRENKTTWFFFEKDLTTERVRRARAHLLRFHREHARGQPVAGRL